MGIYTFLIFKIWTLKVVKIMLFKNSVKTERNLKIKPCLSILCYDFFYPLAQELASQEEKLLLLESSLKATQEQLSEQIAETVRQEQNSRKCQTDLKILKERLTASEEENSDYK